MWTDASLRAYILEDLRARRMPPVKHVTVSGFNNGVGSTSEGVWAAGGITNYPSRDGEQMEVVSSSAVDAPSTSGARTVRLEYLAASTYELRAETITMNGLTAVATTATNICRVLRLYVVAAGTSGQAVGAIDARHLSNAPIYDRIPPGGISSSSARWTIEGGWRGYAWRWRGESKVAETILYSIADTIDDSGLATSPKPFPVVTHHAMGLSDGAIAERDIYPPRRLFVGDDMEVQGVRLHTADVIGTASVDIMMVKTGDRYQIGRR